jgi:hypothetical protein
MFGIPLNGMMIFRFSLQPLPLEKGKARMGLTENARLITRHCSAERLGFEPGASGYEPNILFRILFTLVIPVEFHRAYEDKITPSNRLFPIYPVPVWTVQTSLGSFYRIIFSI